MNTHNKPLAARGLTSYRIRGSHGYIMIGASDHEDAWREAQRSASGLSRGDLEIWNGKAYQKVTLSRRVNSMAAKKRAKKAKRKTPKTKHAKKSKKKAHGEIVASHAVSRAKGFLYFVDGSAMCEAPR